MSTTQERIIELVRTMSEEDAKRQLAEVYLLISEIGIGNYTKENCWTDIENSYKNNVVLKII
ncbi:hypothetical protein ACE3MS_31255 [Paenibacillus dendritiformis]|uniref:hypothetical protein n=1 Tax=Paenibacillus dendritiformis TaxID=130049 RepID=UPI00364D233A